MANDNPRSYIDEAHIEFDRLKQTQTASGTEQDRFNEAILETLHKVIHALDSIEKRIATTVPRAPSRIAMVAGPVVRRQAERARDLIERGQGNVQRFRDRISDSVSKLRYREAPAGHPPEELENEIAELRGDVRSVRDTMEALTKRLESLGTLPR